MIRHDHEGTAFPSFEADGIRYLLTPLYRSRRLMPAGRSLRTFSPVDRVGLRTEGGLWVWRKGRGEYLLTDPFPERPLTSDDPRRV